MVEKKKAEGKKKVCNLATYRTAARELKLFVTRALDENDADLSLGMSILLYGADGYKMSAAEARRRLKQFQDLAVAVDQLGYFSTNAPSSKTAVEIPYGRFLAKAEVEDDDEDEDDGACDCAACQGL